MAKSERKQREFERREHDIIDAAYVLFREQDYTTVTIEQIADKADVGKGTIYKHFQSKEEICARIIIDINNQADVDLRQIGEDPYISFRERLDKIVEFSWDVNMKDEGFLSQLVSQMLRGNFFNKISPELQQEYSAMAMQQQELYLRLIQEAIAEGDIIDCSPESLLYCISATLDGAIYRAWLMSASGVDTSELKQKYMQEMKNYIYRGISAKE